MTTQLASRPREWPSMLPIADDDQVPCRRRDLPHPRVAGLDGHEDGASADLLGLGGELGLDGRGEGDEDASGTGRAQGARAVPITYTPRASAIRTAR
ncbi:hypothetical protein [Streptomyces luteireticuli]|uniref:hypothetical protein n=1 Tax=Streptomyces luteireticuli TaxID=173858 RepID=UPI003557C7E5